MKQEPSRHVSAAGRAFYVNNYIFGYVPLLLLRLLWYTLTLVDKDAQQKCNRFQQRSSIL